MRIKPTKIVVYVSNYLTAFDKAKPQLIVSFSCNKYKRVEVPYKHSPQAGENLNEFIEQIRKDYPHLHAIVFEQLFWLKEETQRFFRNNKIKNTTGLYVENLGILSRIQKDGTYIGVPTSDPKVVVTH